MPASAASSSTAPLVIPSGHAAADGVPSTPPDTRKTLVALVSATKPRLSSIRASSAPAAFASTLARIEVSRLAWWIFGSRLSGAARRTLEVIRVIPDASYTGALCSGSTISVGPDWFSRGSIPLVIFTPLVSVSRMCTPSVMSLACSVRRISRMISSPEGTESNASALADRRNRAKCSSSRKILPLWTRRPSHTASPPCTAESNGLTAASSRCVRRPATLTIRSRLRSLNCCSIEAPLPVPSFMIVVADPRYKREIYHDHGEGRRRGSAGASRRQSLIVHFVVKRTALPRQWLQRGGQVPRGLTVRPETGGLPHPVVPVRGPDAVGRARAGRPGQHRRVERHAERVAQRLQHHRRPAQDVGCVHDWPADQPEDLQLLLETQVGEHRLGAHPRVRGEQLARVPDQERVPQRAQRLPVYLGQQVMRHVLLVVHGRAVRQRRLAEPVEHLRPAGRHRRHDLVLRRVHALAVGEVERVQRLVNDHGVGPVLPGAHQRRGDGPRPGP